MFNKMNLKQRMLVTILGLIFITLTGLLSYIGINNYQEAISEAHALTDAASDALATKVEKDTAAAMDLARTLAESMEAMKIAGNVDRELVNTMLKTIVSKHPEFLGAWTIWEPNAFDGQDNEYAGKPGLDPSGRLNMAWNHTAAGVQFNVSYGYDEPGTGDFYLLAMNSAEETILNPYKYNMLGTEILMTSTVVPIVESGRTIGVVGVDLSMNALQEMVDSFSIYETGFGGIYANDGTILTSSFKERIGKPYGEVFAGDHTVPAIIAAIQEGKELAITDAKDQYKHFTPIGIGHSKTPWSVAVVVPEEEVTAAAVQAMINTAIIGIFVLLVLGAAIYLLTNTIVKPVIAAANIAETMATGDFTNNIPDQYLKREDEIGALAKSFERMNNSLRSIIGDVISSSQNVAAASQEISATTEQIASGSASQAEEAQTMQDLFNELSAAIGTVAENAEETAEIAARTNAVARDGGQIVVSSITSMEEVRRQVALLEKDSNQIGEIIGIIDDIADQTNLLALNAAIEAARAGEQGRGFAVVADEVRKLAERSGSATKEIAAIIKSMQANTAQSVRAVDTGVVQTQRTGEAFENIAAMIGETESKVSEIAAACEEQSAQTQEVMRSIQSIAAASQEAAAASEETAATSQSLARLAEDLNTATSSFKVV